MWMNFIHSLSHHSNQIYVYINVFQMVHSSGFRGDRDPAPPPPGFEAPKLRIFEPYPFFP